MSEIEKPKTFEIAKPEFKTSVLLDYVQQLTKEAGIVKKENCKFCMSQYRLEAEDKYEETKNIKAVQRFFLDKGEQLSYSSVENHLSRHYFVQKRNAMMKDYVEHFEKLIAQKRDKRSQLLERITILTGQIYEMEAMSAGLSLDERRKTADIVRRVAETILAHEKEIELMDASMKPVDILLKHMQQIIHEEIKNSKSEEVKRALMGVIEKCQASLKDVIVEYE